MFHYEQLASFTTSAAALAWVDVERPPALMKRATCKLPVRNHAKNRCRAKSTPDDARPLAARLNQASSPVDLHSPSPLILPPSCIFNRAILQSRNAILKS